MGQLRTGNKRQKRAIRALQANKTAPAAELPVPVDPLDTSAAS